MNITSRFTIAVHTMICIVYFGDSNKVTSNFIAASVNVNPVIIRRILGQLKEAGLVSVEAGVGGASVKKELTDITLLDIFRAVECVKGELFHFHENPNPDCPVGRTIHGVLDSELTEIESAMERQMKSVTLAKLVEKTKMEIEVQGKE